MVKRLSFLLALVIAGCGRSAHEGYKTFDDGVEMRLIALGDGDRITEDGDSLLLDIRMGRTAQDQGELFSTRAWFATQDLRRGALQHILVQVQEGDSVAVIADAAQWPWDVLLLNSDVQRPDTGAIHLSMRVLNMRSPAMIAAENERLRTFEPLLYESRLMHAYLKHDPDPYLKWGTSKMYYRLKGHGSDTASIRSGDQVTISYRGKNMEDGIVFDDTERNGMPLTFRVGDDDQVMKGLEVAVHLLKEGQEGVFLIPSEMAFGSRGVPGLVEPFMPLVYTVRVEQVQREAR